MNGFQCPYCSMYMSVGNGTMSQRWPSFQNDRGVSINGTDESCIQITFYECPNCSKYTILAKGAGERVKGVSTLINPLSLAKHFPDYIPLAIREDYQEACDIVNLSPKASATLSRRCLQGMIRDFYNINENNLAKAIQKLEGIIPNTQWKVIDGVRRIGNIGAHMEKDIDLIIDIEPNEAEKLVKLIEHLLEQWYVNRHNQEQLYTDIIGIDQSKQDERKKTE